MVEALIQATAGTTPMKQLGLLMDFSIPEVGDNTDLTLPIWPTLSRTVDLLRIPTIALAAWILFHSSTVVIDALNAVETDRLTSRAAVVALPCAACLIVASSIAMFRPTDRGLENRLGMALYGWRKRVFIGISPIMFGVNFYSFVGTSNSPLATQDHVRAASIAVMGVWAALGFIFFLTSVLATHEVTFGSPEQAG